LRDSEVELKINRMSSLLTLEHFESPEAKQLAEEMRDTLGKTVSFIIRMEHYILMLRRQKTKNLHAVSF